MEPLKLERVKMTSVPVHLCLQSTEQRVGCSVTVYVTKWVHGQDSIVDMIFHCAIHSIQSKHMDCLSLGFPM